MEMMKVEAVEGRRLPVKGQRGAFVGYRRMKAKSKEKVAFEVTGGLRYEALGPVDVPADQYHLRALMKGDIKAHKPATRRRAEGAS